MLIIVGNGSQWFTMEIGSQWLMTELSVMLHNGDGWLRRSNSQTLYTSKLAVYHQGVNTAAQYFQSPISYQCPILKTESITFQSAVHQLSISCQSVVNQSLGI